ncbi:dickkopf-related protein 1 [Cynoglossus semilaevis]|uniref:dickkopf-related protein 1 n=1 Tax=Cynoglossus semilaevis TaxID=244447 RepID=UPI000D6264D9|nr:dickkopf-related protein 1-like [Cynoglossus semilaevis]
MWSYLTVTSLSSVHQDRPSRGQVESSAGGRSQGTDPACSTPDCHVPVKGSCSNRAQRRSSSQDRLMDKDTDRHRDTDSFNKTKAPEMASCVRSGDCAAGLCCARYLTGKRCQRIPVEGEACLPRGFTKQRRNLGRCNCDVGLACVTEPGKNKAQGVCLPRPRQGQRKTRHSGKKRRTAESGC